MIFDGKIAAEHYYEELKNKVEEHKRKGVCFKLAVVQLVKDDASIAYLNGRRKICEKIGVSLEAYDYSFKTKEEIIELIKELNNNPEISGIMIDRPFPKGMDENEIFSYLDPSKDVDGCTIINAGRLFQNKKCFVPSTAKAVVELMKYYNINVEGKEVVVVGRSKTVGAPLAQLLINNNATVTVCHSKTKDLKEVTKRADIVVVAIGRRAFINEEYVTPNTVIFDVGIHYDEFGKMCGDVDKKIYDYVNSYSPVPRGVGPLTNVALMQNLISTKE